MDSQYCGTTAANCQLLVADKQRIASDPNGAFVRLLGATAYACYPLKASDGHLLGTFAVASATRERFTDDEVTWLGTVTQFPRSSLGAVRGGAGFTCERGTVQVLTPPLSIANPPV